MTTISINASGDKSWFLNGKRHREDGPAIEMANGDKQWFLNGQLHREDGPAIKHSDGTKEWYIDGKRHREDGPALEYANGDKQWYLNGSRHRENGPAVEFANGDKHWYINGRCHREDGPAAEYADGEKHWYINGQLHREDGPAIECADGRKEWYLNGQHYQPDSSVILKLANKRKYNLISKEDLDKISSINKVTDQIKSITQSNKEKENKMATASKTNFFKTMKPCDRIVVKDTVGKEHEAFNFGKSRYDGKALIYVENPTAIMGGFIMNGSNLDSLTLNHGYKFIERNAANNGIDFAKGKFMWANESGVGTGIKVVKKSEGKMKGKNEPTTAKNGLMEMFKADAERAAYRVAGTQITEAVKGLILMGLQTQADVAPAKIDAIREVMESPMGNILVSTLLGHGLEYLPQVGEDPRVQKIAEEFRVQGMATAGNEVMSAAGKYVLPALTKALDNLPGGKADTQMRVETTTPPALKSNDEEIEVEVSEETEALTSAKA